MLLRVLPWLTALWATSAMALEAPAVNVQSFQPSPGWSDGLWLRGAEVQRAGPLDPVAWSGYLDLSYARRPLRFTDGTSTQTVIGDLGMAHLGAAAGFGDGWLVGATLPLAFAMRGGGPNLSQTGIPVAPSLGDLRLEGRKSLKQTANAHLSAAVLTELPTAAAGAWLGGSPALGLEGLASLRLPMQGPVSVRGELNLGVRLRPTGELRLPDLPDAVLRQGSQGIVRAGVVASALGDRLRTRAEVQLLAPLITALPSGPLVDLALGADWALGAFRLFAQAGGSPSSTVGAAGFRGVIGVRFDPRLLPRDTDLDGLDDRDDRCPAVAEDKDGFDDADGCPDPDDDEDGIADAADRCRLAAEDKDGFEDDDGCPDLDNDKDGVPDQRDLCPAQPEDVDGFEDSDGCPEGDNDQDGIADIHDLCPVTPENANGFEDEDGCPDVKPIERPVEPPAPPTPEVAPPPPPPPPPSPPVKPKGKGKKRGK